MGEFQLLGMRSRLPIQSVSLLLILLTIGCAGPVRNPAEQHALVDQATVLGLSNARAFPDTQTDLMVQGAMQALER